MSMKESERLTRREEDDLFSVYLRKALIERLAEYEDIGTVPEFRELKEKATAKKPKLDGYYTDTGLFECPSCGRIQKILYQGFHCKECGQKLDWSEGKE